MRVRWIAAVVAGAIAGAGGAARAAGDEGAAPAPAPSVAPASDPAAGSGGEAPSPGDTLARIGAGASILAEVARAEAAVREAEAAVARDAEEEQRIAADLARARDAEAAAVAAADRAAARLAPRLRARYRALRNGATARALGADPASAARTEKALDHLLAADLALLREAHEARMRLAAARASLEHLEALARIRSATLAEARARFAAGASARDAVVAAVRAEPALRKRVADELAREDRRLREKVRALPATPATGVRARKGGLSTPCPGAILEVPFGKVVNLKFNTVTFQRGWDLRARAGTEVLAPAPGKVAHAAWFGAYGNLLILDHGAGVHTLYAHLADFAKAAGDEVREGEVLGRVGDTGSLKGAYLYFEIREDGKAVDPATWIGRRAR